MQLYTRFNSVSILGLRFLGEESVINYLRQTKRVRESRNIADPTSVIVTPQDSALSDYDSKSHQTLDSKVVRTGV